MRLSFNYSGTTYKALPVLRNYIIHVFVEQFLFSTPEEEPRNPKYIYNIKANLLPSKQQGSGLHGIPECEALLAQMRKEDCKVRRIVMLPEHYVSFNADSRMLDDINRFCVHNSSILLVDTTFDLCDGMWLTDSAFQYEAPLNEKGGSPMFPGQYMWHFRKSQESYWCISILTFLYPFKCKMKQL